MPVNVVQIFEVADYEKQIAGAAARLRDGGVVVLPTETVYGAAGLLSNPATVERLRKLRGGNEAQAFTVHVARAEDALSYLGDVSDLGRRAMKKLWPGPVSLMFDVPEPRRREVAAKTGASIANLYANDTITLRCPEHIVASDVLSEVTGPVALTKVDRGGTIERANFDQLDQKVDLVLEAGPSRHDQPSTIVRIHKDKWEIVRSGIYDQRIIERMLRTTVLFVCSGNTCRSPMAEAIARKVIADHLKIPEEYLESRGYSVLSAGAFALAGAKATPQAVEALRAAGLDLSRHRSRALSLELIHQADVIFPMSRSHMQSIVALVPSAAEKTVMLDPDGDVEDPIGGDLSLYTELAGSLKSLIERRLMESGILEK